MTAFRSLGFFATTCAFVVGSHGCAPERAEEPPAALSEGCQPLAAEVSCALPFPSAFFERPDPASRTGLTVTFTGAAVPATEEGKSLDVLAVFPIDGASRQPSIVAALPDDLASDGLPGLLDDPAISLSDASPSVLLRADTGERLAHYVDVDPDADSRRGLLVIRPLQPLPARTRFVVALRGVRSTDGALARTPDGFRRLRDHVALGAGALAAQAARFEQDVFAPLAAARIERGQVQLAWDFHTGSVESPIADMLRIRELTLAWLARHTPRVTVTQTLDDRGEYARVVRGTITGPSFLEGSGLGARLHRGADGAIAQNDETSIAFRINVPTSALVGSSPSRALVFGHGFFGTMEETDGVEARKLSLALRATTFAADWVGMTTPDLDAVVPALANSPAHAGDFSDRVHQAVANFLVLSAAAKGPLAQLPALRRDDGAPLYDAAHIAYFGASQGHILGSISSALDPSIERAVLNVGGAAFTHMMPRARPFGAFRVLLASTAHDPALSALVVSLLAAPLDRIDPASYAHLLIGVGLPGNPDRQVLMQLGLGDAEVPSAGGFFHARALGLSQTGPWVHGSWAIPVSGAEPPRSAVTIYDFGIDLEPGRRPVPLAENPVHLTLRIAPEALKQMDAFLSPHGTIVHPCNGVCREAR